MVSNPVQILWNKEYFMSESNPLAAPVDGKLMSPGFLGLLFTQFLGSFNDNMFRWLAVPFAKLVIDDEIALSLGLVCFTVPFLLLAAHAGYLADKFSKRKVIVACKVAEIVLMTLGVAAMALGNVTFLFIVVAMMGAQSALFSPAKFGAIPELVGTNKITSANGVMALTSVVACAADARTSRQTFVI